MWLRQAFSPTHTLLRHFHHCLVWARSQRKRLPRVQPGLQRVKVCIAYRKRKSHNIRFDLIKLGDHTARVEGRGAGGCWSRTREGRATWLPGAGPCHTDAGIEEHPAWARPVTRAPSRNPRRKSRPPLLGPSEGSTPLELRAKGTNAFTVKAHHCGRPPAEVWPAVGKEMCGGHQALERGGAFLRTRVSVRKRPSTHARAWNDVSSSSLPPSPSLSSGTAPPEAKPVDAQGWPAPWHLTSEVRTAWVYKLRSRLCPHFPPRCPLGVSPSSTGQ